MTEKTRLLSRELALIGELLEEAGEEFSDHGSNDFMLPNSADNRAIVTAMLEWLSGSEWGDPSWRETHSVENELEAAEIDAFDDWLLSYLAERCKQAVKPEGLPLSAAELEVVARLFDHVIGFREVHDNSGGDYTLPINPENVSFLSAVARHHGGEEGEEKLREIEAADDEIAVSDSWIMGYYADLCRKAAQAAG